MPSYRVLCLLLFPLLAVNAAEDIEDDYSSQGKSGSSHVLSESLSLPPDGIRVGGRLDIPNLWQTLFERLSDENEARMTGDGEAISKRVFCNGFTGCGGRFRGRRRQHNSSPGKRPFCNMSGCGNIGKRAEVQENQGAEDAMRLPEAIRKRLFCNSLTGCRGLKRALYSNWLSKLHGIADDL